MIRSVRKWFSAEKPRDLVIDRAVRTYLLNLPQCTENVVIVGRAYRDRNYRCDVIARADGLFAWAERHAKGVLSFDPQDHAARQALPLWLREANRNDASRSYVPPRFVAVMRPYVLDFINKGIAEIECPVCGAIVRDIEMTTLNERRNGPRVSWTDDWRCGAGHPLYWENHEVKFFCS